jgi:hypothetical protein
MSDYNSTFLADPGKPPNRGVLEKVWQMSKNPKNLLLKKLEKGMNSYFGPKTYS